MINKAVADSNGSISTNSYVQQGDTIEVDVHMPEQNWDVLNKTQKNTMAEQLGKSLKSVVKKSALLSPGKDVCISFGGDPNNDGLADYDMNIKLP
ncbi:hypothetical protein NDK43_26150 [Neobacillus pocheonensis]|uniref:Uncharacterized protein n=1 Tax=Neobacillus pocheonensis TaxID=363869 RepID=A0ABT0WFW4_9BACI|nr:hypothetical protein [Neobacillus pocheonensis]